MPDDRSADQATPPTDGVALADLVAYLDGYLDIETVRDYGPNGLQVDGPSAVRKLVTGVSACRELFVRARSAGADSVLVHHGVLWDFLPRELTRVQYGRVAELVRGEMSLLGYHLPLDRHAEVGNNAVAARQLGLEDLERFGEHRGSDIGYRGRFSKPISPEELLRRCGTVFGREPLAFTSGPPAVATVGIVSGAADGNLWEAIEGGLDAFITGEPSEWVMQVAAEAEIHFVAAGHYATERLGVLALGDHLRQRFPLEVEFIDLPNPV